MFASFIDNFPFVIGLSSIDDVVGLMWHIIVLILLLLHGFFTFVVDCFMVFIFATLKQCISSYVATLHPVLLYTICWLLFMFLLHCIHFDAHMLVIDVALFFFLFRRRKSPLRGFQRIDLVQSGCILLLMNLVVL